MIPVSKPWITNLEKKYANEAIDSGWISSTGRFIDRFETAFAEYIGVKHAISTNTGTAACHLALKASGLGTGDSVVVPAVTFIATANAARYCGCDVLLADIDNDTWNIAPVPVKAKAIFAVHLYGNTCDYEQLTRWCRAQNSVLVEDACEALGGKWRRKMTGSLGLAAAFSFYGNKTISTGEGGMVTTDSDDVAAWARRLRGQGQSQRYFHVEVGYNYRMTNIQAALGLAQIERIEEILAEKSRVFYRYATKLRGAAIFAKQDPDNNHSHWAITIRVPCGGGSERRDALAQALAHEGVETRPAFIPLPLLPPYKDDASKFPNAIALGAEGITLPSYPELTNREIDLICEVVLRSAATCA